MVSRVLASSVGAAILAGSVLTSTTPAWAAKPGHGGPGGGGGTTTTTTGIDVSYPQCSSTLPGGQAFAIVGVNGGLANDYNGCLAAEFSYALQATGTPGQAPAQTYLNTADPGNGVGDWPSPSYPGAAGSVTIPYGGCAAAGSDPAVGANSDGCAWAYGYDMVAGITNPSESIPGDLTAFSKATGQDLYSQPVWLDVETTNSWMSDTTMNAADLQGMVAAIQDAASAAGTKAAPVGVYTTADQWGQIIGSNTSGSLAGLPEWVPGARREKAAVSNCSSTSYTGGTITVTQWTSGGYDYDYSCVG